MSKIQPGDATLAFAVNAPDGVVCGAIGKFVLISVFNDEFTVRWCAIGDVTSWPTPNTDAARAVQAGQETLSAEYGKVTGITGNDFFGYVFQQRAITKFTYVGGDIVFTIDPFEQARGCIDYNRFVRIDDTIFFESEFGYHAMVNDTISNIGDGWVDDSYPPVSSDSQSNVVANIGIDTVFFEGRDLAYNYVTGQWTLLSALSSDTYYPIDDADGVVGQIVYSGTAVDLQTSAGGVAQTATITTGDSDLNQGGMTYIGGVRPLVDGGTWTVRVGSRPNLSTSISWSTSTSVTAATGMADFREEGRYQRFEFTNSDGFNTAMGADIDAEPAGKI